MLAEVPVPDPVFFMSFLGCGLFLLMIMEKLKSLFGKTETQKREVSFSEQYATKQEVNGVRDDVRSLEEKLDLTTEKIREEMKHDRELILRAGEERAVKLHDRCNKILEGVSRMEGRLFDK